ncbi:MAG: nucleoside recognition protein [bacterium]|nr:nucleoside recognition protein [bacterium]
MKKSLFSCFSVFFLMSLLFYPQLSFEGAKNGLLLWYQTVVPTLFPFMTASKLAVASGGATLLIRPLYPLCKKLLHLSEEGTYTLFSGLLCGYPMGAKTCSDFLEQGTLSLQEGRFLVAVCNLPSPMFLLGYLSAQAGGELSRAKIFLVVYGPLLPLSAAAWFCYRMYRNSAANPRELRQKSTRSAIQKDIHRNLSKSDSIDDIFSDCCLVLLKIGCYMVLFSVMAAFFSHSSLPPLLKPVAVGLMEMTTGIHTAAILLKKPVSWFFMLLFAVFGGFSGLFQTKSVMKNAGLSIRHYMGWKMLHTALSALYFVWLCI